MNAAPNSAEIPGRRLWALVFVAALFVYAASASPVVFWGDSAELSRRALTLDLLPTARGYPLHRVLAWLAGRLTGDAGYGTNLVSAVFGATTLALLFETGRLLGRSPWAGFAAAAATGFAHTFWTSAGVAEVYTLHTAFLAAAFLLAVKSDSGRPGPRFALGIVLGLSLLHHRMIAFAVPGIVVHVWTGAPAGARIRAALEVAAGAIVGAIPFALLCIAASRTPPAGTANAAWWWFQDVFMGGERNAGFILGEGRKGLGASALYLARFLAFNLPGPALLLALVGVVCGGRRLFAFLVIEIGAHLWFPLNYDWTGDQYSFLVPLYPILGLAAAVAVGAASRRWSPRVAAPLALTTALAPLALYAAAGLTGLATKILPGLTPEAARATLLPVHGGDRRPRAFCERIVSRLPKDAVLHCDWGDGQILLYLQDAEGLRRDVKVDVWITAPKLGDGTGEEWLSVLPFTRELPRSVAPSASRLEDHGEGLFRVLPERPR